MGEAGTHTGEFLLPDTLCLLDFSMGNTLCQGYLGAAFLRRETVAVRPSRSLPPSPFWSNRPVLSAGWAAQDCGQHRGHLGLVSANFASWSAWAVSQHRFLSPRIAPGTSNAHQPAVKAAGKIKMWRHSERPRVPCPGTSHHLRRGHKLLPASTLG